MRYLNLALIVLYLLISNQVCAIGLDSLIPKKHFELSFGQSLLFLSNSKQANIRSQQALVIPTNAVLFFAELRPDKTLRIPIFLNIPTESKQFLVNGVLANEKASPTLGTGVSFKVFSVKIDDKSMVDFEGGPLVSVIFDSKNNIRMAPIIGSRFKLTRGENFVMYFGVSYSLGINALGILYGTGTNF
jgi:hypothetical protein